MVGLTFGFSFCEFGFGDVLGCLDVMELVQFGISWGLCCCGVGLPDSLFWRLFRWVWVLGCVWALVLACHKLLGFA